MSDLTIYDQMFIISLATALMAGAVYAGMFLKEQETKEAKKRREIESAAHTQAVKGLQGHRRTDLTV